MTPTLGRTAFAGLLIPALALGMRRVLPATGATSTTGASLAELTARLSALERRNAVLERELATLVQSTPSPDLSRVKAPFEVVDRAGRPILRVMEGEPTGAGVVITSGVGGARHGVYILHPNGTRVAGIGQAPAGHGALTVRAPDGRTIFAVTEGEPTGTGIVVTGGEAGTRGGLYVLDGSGHRLAALGQSGLGVGTLQLRDERGTTRVHADGSGTLVLSDANGKGVLRVAENPAPSDARGSAQVVISGGADGGAVRVANKTGKVVVGMLGGVRGAGAVVVANPAGQGVAEMSVSDDGRGLLQIFGRAGRPVAVLTQAVETPGGLLQISNQNGPVTSITVGANGGGYWQLNDAAGTPTVEAGTLPSGVGAVRTGPRYKCFPAQAATPVIALGLPDCIMGSAK
jgi:hypothetical protein